MRIIRQVPDYTGFVPDCGFEGMGQIVTGA